MPPEMLTGWKPHKGRLREPSQEPNVIPEDTERTGHSQIKLKQDFARRRAPAQGS